MFDDFFTKYWTIIVVFVIIGMVIAAIQSLTCNMGNMGNIQNINLYSKLMHALAASLFNWFYVFYHLIFVVIGGQKCLF